MAKYLVDYYETYNKSYEIEADSKEEAEEKVRYEIQEGTLDPPENCSNSWCETEEMESNSIRYTHDELKHCLEGRLKWYEKALEYRNKNEFPPIGFVIPDGNFRSWEGAVRELKNTLDMMK